jgi:gamma-glutamyl-gamma-aminobutyraldehyde dehydrogenase
METLDCGKPISDSLAVDLPDTIETLRWHAEAVDKIYDQMSPSPSDVVSMIVREPIGVVGTVLPWNFPLFVAMWKIAPALAGGNSMVVKPAEQTPLTARRGCSTSCRVSARRRASASEGTWTSTA